MRWLEVERLISPGGMDSVAALCPNLLGEGKPKRSDSYDQIFQHSPTHIFSTVVVQNVNLKKKTDNLL